MKKLIIFLCSGAVFLSFGSGKMPNTTAKKTMNSVFKGFMGLIPYMGDPMKFKDPANKEEIHTHLSTIKSALGNAKHVKTFNLPGFSPSFEQVRLHIKETLDAFELGQPDFARVRLRATGQLCISCHTQLKSNGGQLGLINQMTRADFTSDFDYAEFLFLIRDYKKSQRYYEKEIATVISKTEELAKLSKAKKLPYMGNRIEASLEKILTVHTKVDYNPSLAIALLDKYRKNKNLSEDTRQRVTSWIISLKKWEKIKRIDFKKESHLDKFLQQHVKEFSREVSMYDGSHDVTLLISSGVLYKHLIEKPKGETGAKLLYWISKIDHLLSNSYLFSLSELYLKRCITEHSKSPWANKCYKAYEDQISFGYTGSSGKSIPDDEIEEMKRLKALIK